MGPSDALVQSFSWARKCKDFLLQYGKSDWLFKLDELPTSSWFSGYGCAETAMKMINSALREETGKNAFRATMQYEINARARAAAARQLPENTCQFVDILRLLSADSRKALAELEKNTETTPNDLWQFLLKQTLLHEELCPKHMQRWGKSRTRVSVLLMYTHSSSSPIFAYYIDICMFSLLLTVCENETQYIWKIVILLCCH